MDGTRTRDPMRDRHVFLPASLAYSGDLALVSQLSEADTADAVLLENGVGSSAEVAACVSSG